MDERLDTKGTLEMIWQRIMENEGSEFRQIRGRTYTYKLAGYNLVPSTTLSYFQNTN